MHRFAEQCTASTVEKATPAWPTRPPPTNLKHLSPSALLRPPIVCPDLKNCALSSETPQLHREAPALLDQRLGPTYGQPTARHTFYGMIGDREGVWSSVTARREVGLTSPSVRLAACALFGDDPWL
jgi:hypothetical protein